MSRKEINIGVEGNDGTGDSIRDSFKKVNENFQELYAVLGQEGALSFIGLDDVLKSEKNAGLRATEYKTTDTNKILVVDGDTEEIVFKELRGDNTIVINQNTAGVISFSSLASALINDGSPTLAANLNANFKRLTNLSPASVDTDAATKGYVDTKLSLAGVDAINPETGSITPDWGTMTGPLVLARNPIDSDDVNYGGLVASTKAYVDSKTFSSITNIYVTTNGQDYRTDIPESAKGRFWSTAFRSVQRACELAEQLVNEAPIELGPYQKILTFNNGTEECTLSSIIESPLSGAGATAQARLGLDPNTEISIFSGGTGYEIGDELGISGGSAIVPAVVRVVAKDFAGSVTQVAIVEQGVYTLLPDDLDEIQLVGGSGSGPASISARFTVTSIIVTASGSGYGSGASVIVTPTGLTGGSTEAYVTEIGGEIKEVTISRGGIGYDAIPTVDIFLPRLLLETENKGTDFEDDIREGQCLRGLNSRAVAKIISHSGARDSFGREIFDIELISGVFETNEVIEYGEPVKDIQITIEIESGIFYENFPLRIPPNVSLRGSEFRRAIIRPKQGVSESPWARLYFRRDLIIDGLRTAAYEYGYQYLTDPLDFSSRPLNNNEMDVFLCGDATIVRNLTVQGHGGFSMVLDPNSQIGSKSPYCQTGTSFSRSINEKQFAGGQFVDGFSGNLEGILLGRVGTSTEKIIIGGLIREPQLPNSFVLGGELYRITLANRKETAYFGAKVLLEQNRAFIQEETIAWINGEFPTLVYDEDKCYRDVGLIVDAVVQDVLYGGYLNSTQAGRLYFNNGVTVVSGQVSETADAIAKAKEIAVFVINQNLWSAVGNVVQTTIPSITDGDAAEATLETCFDLIENIVRRGDNIYAAKTLLQANKELIQSEVIAYINTTYPSLDYDEAFCKRDTGFAVDAVSIDIFGDFNNSLRVGHSHFRQAGRVFPADQVDETLDALEYAKTLMQNMVASSAPALLRTTKTFNPINDVNLTNNSITIPGHSFTNGSRVKYSNGGGTSLGITAGSLTNNGVYYTYVLDGNRVQLFDTLELVIAREKEVNTSIEINITSVGTGTAHTLSFHQQTDVGLTPTELTAAGIDTNINTAIAYVTALIADGSTADVPEIYPQYECVLDTPFYGATAGPFDEAYCSRDVGLILNATAYDFVLGSNYQSVNAGRAYLRSYAAEVTTNQKTATINALIKTEEDALKLIPGSSYSAARTAFSNRIQIVRDIIQDGLTAVPAITYPTPTALSPTDNKVKAKNILVANRAFIQAEITAWIAVQVAGNIAPFTSGFSYNSSACARDVGYIIDAMCYDILYSGNSMTKNAAESYYSALLPGGTIPGDEDETVAAFERLRTILGFIVVNDNSSWTKSAGNLLNQDISNPSASATETARTVVLSNILIDYVLDGDYDAATATVNPTLTGQNSDLIAARLDIVDGIADIQVSVIDFVSNGRGKITIGTAGNKSMLGNDFTQVNDMGYGIFATNNGLIESVSMFTYYCYTAMFALNGAQIRCLNGSSAHGVFGLKAEGADPNEVPDSVTLKFPLVQTANAYENPSLDLVNSEGELTVYVTNYQYVPRSGSFIDIDHTGDPGGNVRLGLRTYIVNTASTQDLPTGVCSLGLALVTGQAGLAIDVPDGKPLIIRQNEELVLGGKEEIVATRPSTALIFDEDRTNTIRVLSFEQYEGVDAIADDVIVGSKDGYNYVNIPVLEGSTSFTIPTWSGNLGDDQIAIQALSFVDSQRVVFPVTGAAIYDGSSIGTGGHIFGYQDSLYEIQSYELNSANANNPIGVLTFRNLTNPLVVTRSATVSAITQALPCVVTTSSDQYIRAGRRIKFTSIVGMTELNGNTYYVDPVTYNITATATNAGTDFITVSSVVGLAVGQYIRFSGVSFGGIVAGQTYIIHTVGVTTIGITATTGGALLGLTTDTGTLTATITSVTNFRLYNDSALTTGVDSTGYTAFVSGVDSFGVLGGLTYSVNSSNGNLTLNSGIRAGAVGDITVNISTMRATGHDFLDIGTGSYADTNYPNNIFGPAANSPDAELQVVEVGKGRVFFVSTDQSGNFRVGDFFAVDQGTGQVTLDANINLRGIDSLRLRNGQEISEFSNDTSLGGSGLPDSQAVPTENAIRTYIDRRLGLSHFSVRVTDGLIGPGYLALNGELSMKGNLDMDNNRLLNLPAPTQGIAGGEEAVPRNFMKMANLEDGPAGWRPETGSPVYGVSNSDILVFTGTGANFTNATVGGYLTFTRSGTTINATINDNTIVDADINYDAAIGQHKLALNTVKATTADGFTVSAYTANTTVSTTVTANAHGFSNGDVVVISGETTVTAINGDWKISSVSTNSFDIPANTSSGGVISGAAKVRLYGMMSGAKDIEFTVVNGFLALKDSVSTTTGISRNKLAWIDPSVYDATDSVSLSGTVTKVLGRRGVPATGLPTGPVVPLDARTIVEDADGLSRAEVPSVGAVVRTATGVGPSKFSTVAYSSANTAGNIVQRSASDGSISVGPLSTTGITSSGSVTVTGGIASTDGLLMLINSTTQSVLTRVLDDGASNAYYTLVRNGTGGSAIRANNGDTTARQYTSYIAREHRFTDTGGSTNGIIDVKGGTLASTTTGGALTNGSIQGFWNVASGSRMSATWADLAEFYSSDVEYEPGTVVEFGGNAEVTVSKEAATTRVAGVVSTDPAFVMNSEQEGTRVCVALQGRVPCKVVGKIKKGDLMVTSGITGVAVSAGSIASPGTIIGKALENYDSDSIGKIEIVVGRS
jgi:hypothetical protein